MTVKTVKNADSSTEAENHVRETVNFEITDIVSVYDPRDDVYLVAFTEVKND